MSVGGSPSGSRVDDDIRLVIVDSPDRAAPLVGALDAADVGAWVWIESERALYFSPRVLDVLDLERESDRPLLSRFLTAVHADDRDLVGRLVMCEFADGPFVLRHRLVRQNGEQRWIENRGRVERARDGSLRRQGGTMRDVTREVEQEQHRVTVSVAEHRRRVFEALLTDIAATVVRRPADDLDTAVAGGLQRVAHFFGASVATLCEVDAGGILRVTHWWIDPTCGPPGPAVLEMDSPLAADMIATLRENNSIVIRTLEELPTGLVSHDFLRAQRLKSLAIVPARREDGVLTVLGLAAPPDAVIEWPNDTITLMRLAATLLTGVLARHHAEAQRREVEHRIQETQKLESLGILAGGIAHDFNNLLTAILGNASLLRTELPATQQALTSLEQIEAASSRAADLCRQMLAYAGKGRFALQTLDINEVVRDSQSLIRVSVPKRAVLTIDLADDLPPVFADHSQLQQVLMNLMINAAEALGEGEGTITIRTDARHLDAHELAGTVFSPQLIEGPYVVLSVRDTGVGMTPEVLSRIFDPFFSTKFTGRGLGLPAVVGIVRAHHGGLRVYSTPGAGSTFELLLRAQPGRASVAADDRQVPDEATLARWRTTGTALVVDDENGVRELLKSVLERAGFTVVIAEDGREAVEAFRPIADTVTLALIDLTMPGLDGRETLAAMRSIKPDLRAILMSGYSPADMVNAASHGFLQKPFTPYTVRKAVWKTVTLGT
jgi:signal transduction histidine kinase/CheY-like chemotaxis protein